MQTESASPRPARSFPLRLHLATAFVLLTSLVGALTVYHIYLTGADLVLAAGEETFAHAARETGQQVRDLLAPAKLQLDLAARHAVGAATTGDDRLAAVPFLATALDGNASLAAARVGFDDGALLEVRRASEVNGAPADAAYIVDDIAQGGGSLLGRRLFLDGGFRVLRADEISGEDRDPRYQRWFHQATAAAGVIRTDMSVLTGGKVGTTLSRRAASGRGAVAFDIALDTLSTRLAAHRLTPSTQIALIDHDGHVIAHPDRARLVERVDRRGRPRLPAIFDTGEEVLGDLYRDAHGRDAQLELPADGRDWIGVARVIVSDIGDPVSLLLAVPRDELLAAVRATARNQVLISLLIVALALSLAWLLSRRLSRPLERLAGEALSIRSFDFSHRAELQSRIIEVDELARAMTAMRSTIRQFLETSATLAAERRLDRLLERVVADTTNVTGAQRGRLYLLSDDGAALVRAASGIEQDESAFPERVAPDATAADPVARAAASRATVVDHGDGRRVLLATPLANREGELVGALGLELAPPGTDGGSNGLSSLVAFVEALSGVAAIAIETRHHVKAQRELLNSLIELLATAIDAKSPYTGGHCQRVPALAQMLARAACDAREGPFRDFALAEQEWETLHLAAWLHDCGKVTTPEYVVDKATKLETLYNRIHEVRARFEILKRDAEIACWKAIAAGADAELARRTMQAAWRELDEDFAFIARCNVGGEAMAAEDMRRVRQIAGRTWTRTIDDRLGLSEEERRRLAAAPAVAPPPTTEALLADRPEHLVPRRPEDVIPPDNPWGFKLSPPQHRLNLGEVHSLCVARGTLTAEERYLINDHIVQTIIMLSKLPFPRALRSVPEVACGHHERMDGTGYPRGLRAADMSIPARIMAIADVFEALTAADRPYKPGKAVSEALGIMRTMAETGHIDPDLFALFVAAGVPRRYAEQFLDPAQRESVEAAA
jgi:HD-GYP domain-containing protein (c-di-GMP phosphodiesterase class II)